MTTITFTACFRTLLAVILPCIAMLDGGCSARCPNGHALDTRTNKCIAIPMPQQSQGAPEGPNTASGQTAAPSTQPDDEDTLASSAGSGAREGDSSAGAPSGANSASDRAGSSAAEPASDSKSAKSAVSGAMEGPCSSNPGATLCVGAEMHTCNQGGTADAVESCMSEILCQVGLSFGKCATCNPGTFECSGRTLSECQEGALVSIDTCSSPVLCNEAAGLCTEMACRPAAKSCAANGDLQTCNADGSAFEQTDPCGANLCDAVNGRCNVCAPNVVSCENDAAVRCNPDGQGSTKERCEPTSDCYTAACRSGACQNAPKRRGSDCAQGVCDGTGSCVQCLADTDCMANEMCTSDRQCVQRPCGNGRSDPGEMCDPAAAEFMGGRPPSTAPSGACDPVTCQFTNAIYQYNCGTTPNVRLWGDWVCNGVGAPSKPCTSASECRTKEGKGSCITYGPANGTQIRLCGILCREVCPGTTRCQDLVGSDESDTCGYSCEGPGCEGYVPPP